MSWHFKFSRRNYWEFMSSGLWRCIFGCVVPDVSKNRSVFKIPEDTKSYPTSTWRSNKLYPDRLQTADRYYVKQTLYKLQELWKLTYIVVFSGNINSPYNSPSDHYILDHDPFIVFTAAPSGPWPQPHYSRSQPTTIYFSLSFIHYAPSTSTSPAGPPNKTLYGFLVFPKRAMCSIHLKFLNFVNLVRFCKGNYLKSCFSYFFLACFYFLMYWP
jgi:hypothetical protein